MSLDEMNAEDGSVRRPYARVADWLTTVSPEQMERRRVEAELFYRRGGITFAVYGDAQGEERIIPYDIIPRILSTQEWSKLAAGLEQRVKALNAYLRDIYGPQEILKAGHRAARAGVAQSGVPAGDVRGRGAARRLHPYRRHRHRARGCGRVLCAGGQCAHALRRLLHAGRARDLHPPDAGAVPVAPCGAGRELPQRVAGDACNRWRRVAPPATRPSRC